VDRFNLAVDGTNNYAVLHIDEFTNGVRGASLAEAGFVYGANSSLHFLELRITSDGVTTNATLKIFADAAIPGSGLDTNRLIDTTFDTATPEASVTLDLPNYHDGFLALYAEDNSNMTDNNPANGIIRFSNFYAQSGTFPPFITLSASTPLAYENGASGAFTLSRTNTGEAMTVNYTLSGTATNGTDYQTLSGSTNFGASDTTVDIPVVPIDNSVADPPRTVVLTVTPDEAYAVAGSSSAAVTIVDDEPPVFTATASDTNAYERVPLLTASLTIARPLGNPDTSVTVNFSLGGTAVLGTDYTSSATNSLAFGPGVTSQDIVITPIDNSIVDGDRTVICTVQAGTGYAVAAVTNAGTAVIVDDELPTETVLWSDDFDSGADDATNYTITAAARVGVDDYTTNWFFDYINNLLYPPAPHGSTNYGLLLSANKDGGPYASAAVNLYPIGQSFTNNFALRFNLLVQYEPATTSQENALFGINHSGLATNWSSGSYSNILEGDGIRFSVNTMLNSPGSACVSLYACINAGGPPVLVAQRLGTDVAAILNSPPFAVLGGVPFESVSADKTWVDVEVSQVGSLITLKLNNTPVMELINTTAFTSGNIMLGYNDSFDSFSSLNTFAVFDNVRVVQLAAPPVTTPQISNINVSGTTVQVDFAGGMTDAPANFKLQNRASIASGSFADDDTAVITILSAGVFRATTSTSGSAEFYRVRRQ